MCSHYQALKNAERYKKHFHVDMPLGDLPADVWPGYLSTFIRRANQLDHAREACVGIFGMVPHWAEPKLARSTYNSRSETSASKPSFREAWKRGHRCIIPADFIFEPSYETGKAVSWRIADADREGLGIAGLWDRKPLADGGELLSFTMLTINADDHPLMRRFHKPGEEKRMVVVLDPADYDRWLDCPADQMQSFMTQYPAERMMAEAAARLAR